MKKKSLFLLSLLMAISFFAVPAVAILIPPVDLDTIDKGGLVVSMSSPFTYFELIPIPDPPFMEVETFEEGSFESQVWYNEDDDIYTYTYIMTPGVSFISEFNTTDNINHYFNGVAGWDFDQAFAAGGPGDDTAFQVGIDPDGTIDYMITEDPVYWNLDEEITLFYQATWGPELGQLNVINAHPGGAVGYVPTPEPAALFLVGSGLIALVAFRKKFRKV